MQFWFYDCLYFKHFGSLLFVIWVLQGFRLRCAFSYELTVRQLVNVYSGYMYECSELNATLIQTKTPVTVARLRNVNVRKTRNFVFKILSEISRELKSLNFLVEACTTLNKNGCSLQSNWVVPNFRGC